tara:strand:- start:7573 stop:8250 length:678 start_codon:yes stop_codon:yes gene_type:complete
MIVIECDQGTEEWFLARQGIPTASNFGKIITPSTGAASKSQLGYIAELIADTAMGGAPEGVEGYTSRAMQHGIETEPAARAAYSLIEGGEVKQVGFCVHDSGLFGGSPDGLVGDDGGLELKCPNGSTHVEYLMAGVLPIKYKCQVHGSLLVTGRKWWDFMSFSYGLPPFIIRVFPDDFTASLHRELLKFCGNYKKWQETDLFKSLYEPKPEPTAEEQQAAVDAMF